MGGVGWLGVEACVVMCNFRNRSSFQHRCGAISFSKLQLPCIGAIKNG